MKIFNAVARGKDGFPVEGFYNRPFTNFIRLLLHTDIVRTWKWRHDGDPFNWPATVDAGSGGVCDVHV